MPVTHGGSAAATTDSRLKPQYFTDLRAADHPVLRYLLGLPSVFDIKPAMGRLFDGEGPDLPPSKGVVEDGALVSGRVVVEDGARIERGARVTGPVLVCRGATVGFGAQVRDTSVIGPDCRIGLGADIARSLLAGGIFAKHACFVGDSVLGRGVNVGAFVATTGLRVTSGPVREPARDEVYVLLNGTKIGTGQTKFGAVVGDDVIVPAGTVLQPGTLIGPGSILYPRTQVGGFLPAGSQAR